MTSTGKDILSEFKESDGGVDEFPGPIQIMLMVRLADWRAEEQLRWAFSYALLRRIEFDRDEQLTIFFPSHKVKVSGLKLELLFERLAQHKVALIAEPNLTLPDSDEIVVPSIPTQKWEDITEPIIESISVWPIE